MEWALAAEAQPLPIPQQYQGRRRIPNVNFPDSISTTTELIQFVSSRLGQNTHAEELQKLAFTILHHTILGPDVLRFVAEHYLKSFSKITWGDIYPYFRHSLDTSIYRDHQAIRPYRLQRSRLPMPYFKFICSQLDVSRLTLGRMCTLENESAKQMYMSPIPSTLLSLFSGRLINLPEHTLRGRITTSGRCEFSITLQGMIMLLFVEFKDSLAGSHEKHSNVIAQIIAEADGADLFNQIKECDGIAIHAILTDGQAFEFFMINFYHWKIMRGVGSPIEAIPWQNGHQICLPPSERSPDYLPTLKQIIEVIFDTFITAYINGISAQKNYSARRARIEDSELGDVYVPRHSTIFWDAAYTRAKNSLDMLRHAHGHRIIDKSQAEQMALHGLQLLNESVMSIPLPEMDWSLLDSWESREDALMDV